MGGEKFLMLAGRAASPVDRLGSWDGRLGALAASGQGNWARRMAIWEIEIAVGVLHAHLGITWSARIVIASTSGQFEALDATDSCAPRERHSLESSCPEEKVGSLSRKFRLQGT